MQPATPTDEALNLKAREGVFRRQQNSVDFNDDVVMTRSNDRLVARHVVGRFTADRKTLVALEGEGNVDITMADDQSGSGRKEITCEHFWSEMANGQISAINADSHPQQAHAVIEGVDAGPGLLGDRLERPAEPLVARDGQRAGRVRREKHPAVAVGEHQVVPDALEERGDRRLERGGGVAGHQAAEHPVGLVEVVDVELRLDLEPSLQVLLVGAQAGPGPADVQRAAECDQGRHQRERVPERQPPADRAHVRA